MVQIEFDRHVANLSQTQHTLATRTNHAIGDQAHTGLPAPGSSLHVGIEHVTIRQTRKVLPINTELACQLRPELVYLRPAITPDQKLRHILFSLAG